MAMERDAIAAIATAAGRAAVGLVRVSGPAAAVVTIAQSIAGRLPEPRSARLRSFRDADGRVIDSGLLLHFPAPASYTGEDLLECQVHGSPLVLQQLLAACLAAGARPARPGEFTERAWLNGRMDLIQAEAVADLIEARSQQALHLARRAMGGVASDSLRQLETRLSVMRARLEATIDFAEETAQAGSDAALVGELQQLSSDLRELAAASERSQRRREGLRVVIVGPPNAGKSSLFNRLLGTDRALVSADPGTTRDIIDAEHQIGGISVWLCDTAGLRDAEGSVEAEGVRRAREQLREADVWLLVSAPDVLQASAGLREELLGTKPCSVEVLQVMNKADLAAGEPVTLAHPEVAAPGGEAPDSGAPARSAYPTLPASAGHNEVLMVSARTGQGLDALQARLQELAGAQDAEGIGLTRARHSRALAQVAAAVEEALALMASGEGPELAAEALRLASAEFDALFGRHADSEALLGEIFSRFCIGK
jgi:tRNA modification GTPase